MSLETVPLALLTLAAAVAGYGAGVLHFRSLERVASWILQGRPAAVALQLARLTALGLFLWLCTLLGVAALLAAAAGLLLGRARVMREARR